MKEFFVFPMTEGVSAGKFAPRQRPHDTVMPVSMERNGMVARKGVGEDHAGFRRADGSTFGSDFFRDDPFHIGAKSVGCKTGGMLPDQIGSEHGLARLKKLDCFDKRINTLLPEK